MLTISHVIPSMAAGQGGPVSAVAMLSTALTAAEHRVTVWTTARAGDGRPPALGNRVQVYEFDAPGKSAYRSAPEMLRQLRKFECDLIHSHGLWTFSCRAAAAAAAARKVPHLLAPCGMLQPPALEQQALKKKLGMLLFQGRILRQAACLQAKSRQELDGIRKFGLKNPVSLIPNPIQEPPPLAETELQKFRLRHGLGDKRVVLFMGRVCQAKGVRRLLEAWAGLEDFHAAWRLVLAGPDEGRWGEKLCRELLPGRKYASVVLPGCLYDNEKWLAYGVSELFVQPSDYESFGTAIGEALAAGKPVITTTGTPWNTLRTKGCGWWIEPDAKALAATLRDALRQDQEQLAASGARGKFMVKDYSVAGVCTNLLQVYEWLCGKGPQPAAVL